MANQIGQLRYTGSGCISKLGLTADYQSVTIGSGTESTSTSFQDIVIKPTSSFVKNRDYYFKIAIPQDMNYEMKFNLKLIKLDNANNISYQFLKTISIPRGGSGENVYSVVLYEYTNNGVTTTQAMIPLPYVQGATNIVPGAIYYRSSDKTYWLGRTSSTYVQTDKFTEVSVVASWKNEQSDNYGVFELTFRPVEDSFTGILLEMHRTAEDYSIQRIGSNGTTEYGRKVDLDKLKQNNYENVQLYQFNNLVDLINKGKTLSRIGVWSHPGLVMVINGEEIRVGPSGYYEQDVIPVSSLGIMAKNNSFQDNWTLDYTYDTTELTTVAEGV